MCLYLREATLNILLIDDDDRVRRTVTLMLKELGHQVLEADSGITGLQRFKETSPDLVITDIIMPDMEGVETIVELRRLQPEVRIIAMSGGGRIKNTDFLKLASSAGAAATLSKPFDDEDLEKAIAVTARPKAK